MLSISQSVFELSLPKIRAVCYSDNTNEFNWLWHFMPSGPLHSNKHLSQVDFDLTITEIKCE